MDPFSLPPEVGTAATPLPPSASHEVPLVAAEAPRPKRGRIVGALAAVAVVAAGGVVVAKNIQSASGGFDSPDAAVRALLKAADQEDLLGVIDVMRPGERAMLRDTLVPLEQEMERLDVLSKRVDMHHVPGLHLTVQGLTTTTDNLADRVAVVNLTGGTMTTNASVADLPLGPLLRDRVKGGSTGQPTTAQLSGARIATVKEDGRWYVSLGYSIAEAARKSSGGAVPDFAHPIPSPGAADPAAAAKDMLTDIAHLDLSAAIGLLAPSEFGALQDYGTLFVSKAQGSIDSFKTDNKVSVEVTPGTAKVDRSGSRATVSFDGVTANIHWAENTAKVVIDANGCSTLDTEIASSDGEPTKSHQRVCPGDAKSDTVKVPADVQPVLDRLSTLSLRTVVVEEGGHWYIAPIRTLFDFIDQVAKAFTSDADITAVQKWLGSLFTSTLDGITGDGSGITTGTEGSIGPLDSVPLDTTPIDTTPLTSAQPLPAILAAFDEAFRAHQQAGEDPSKTLAAMQADGSIPPGLVFLDSTGAPVTDGSFTDVIGVRAAVDGSQACMIFGPDSATPADLVDCP
jgi:hypothetical protein